MILDDIIRDTAAEMENLEMMERAEREAIRLQDNPTLENVFQRLEQMEVCSHHSGAQNSFFVDFCIILPGAIKLIETELEGCFYSQICYILIFKLHRISRLLMFCFVKLDFLSAFISIFQVFCFLHKINFVKFIMCLDWEIWRINFLIIKLFFTKKKYWYFEKHICQKSYLFLSKAFYLDSKNNLKSVDVGPLWSLKKRDQILDPEDNQVCKIQISFVNFISIIN